METSRQEDLQQSAGGMRFCVVEGLIPNVQIPRDQLDVRLGWPHRRELGANADVISGCCGQAVARAAQPIGGVRSL